jgi:hypothetical protein
MFNSESSTIQGRRKVSHSGLVDSEALKKELVEASEKIRSTYEDKFSRDVAYFKERQEIETKKVVKRIKTENKEQTKKHREEYEQKLLEVHEELKIVRKCSK